MKISENINIAGGNLARPTKFTAIVTPPLALVSSYNQRSFDVLCKSAGVPEVTMETIDLIFKGHTLKVPGRVNQQQEITITFYLDEFHKLRKLFYDWVSTADDRFYGYKSVRAAAGYEEYNPIGASIILKTRDFVESNSTPMDYYFENVFPTNVSGPEFSSGGTNEVLEFSVTFGFQSFRHLDSDPDQIPDIDNYLDSFSGAQ